VIRVPEIPDRTFPAEATRIADALQPGSRTLLTEIEIPNPDGVLKPGIYCTVELQIPQPTANVTVPSDAIIFNASGVRVAVVQSGFVHLREVDIARDLGTEVEVRNGVEQGENVILNPSVDLAEGAKVKVVADSKT
jgi:multidrug efflux pump subunit AcrA (membrane-fusion protein)